MGAIYAAGMYDFSLPAFSLPMKCSSLFSPTPIRCQQFHSLPFHSRYSVISRPSPKRAEEREKLRERKCNRKWTRKTPVNSGSESVRWSWSLFRLGREQSLGVRSLELMQALRYLTRLWFICTQPCKH